MKDLEFLNFCFIHNLYTNLFFEVKDKTGLMPSGADYNNKIYFGSKLIHLRIKKAQMLIDFGIYRNSILLKGTKLSLKFNDENSFYKAWEIIKNRIIEHLNQK